MDATRDLGEWFGLCFRGRVDVLTNRVTLIHGMRNQIRQRVRRMLAATKSGLSANSKNEQNVRNALYADKTTKMTSVSFQSSSIANTISATMISRNVGTTWNSKSYQGMSVPLQLDKNRSMYLKCVVDGGSAIKDPEYFTCFALGMPGKGEMK